MGLKFSKKRHKPRISKSQIPWLLRGAIRSNNVGTLQYLFSYPHRVNPSMVIDGVCPLNLAIELGHLQMVKILIKAGADIYVTDASRYPLHQASLFGRAEIAELLIRSGASVSALTERRQSCLHLLSHQMTHRYLETARVILKYNVNPNTLDDDGLAPLHRASIELIQVLVFHEATDVNICSRDGDTPLLTAVKDRRESYLIALIKADQLFHDQYAAKQLNQASPFFATPPYSTHRTSSSKSFNAIASCTSAAVATLNRIGSYGQTRKMNAPSTRIDGSPSKIPTQPDGSIKVSSASILCRLSGRGQQRHGVVRRQQSQDEELQGRLSMLGKKMENCQRCHSVGNPYDVSNWWQQCERVQNIPTKPINTNTHEHVASNETPQHPMRLPTRPKLDLDKPDKIGMTALMLAAEAGSSGLNMAMALIQAGSNVNLTDKVGMTALHHACYVGSLNMVQFLLERRLRTSTHQPRGSEGLRLGVDSKLLNSQDKYGRTPIYLASSRGHAEVVIYLLSYMADIHIPNKEHKSPLYISAYFGYLEIANALLRHGAKVDQLDSHHKTPLYVATYHGRSEIVDLLLHAGANVNEADKNGKTPLYVAVLHGNLGLARKLLDSGASVNRVDHEGLGPLHMAVKFPKLDIPMVKLLLLEYGCDPVNLASFTRWLLVHGIIPRECIHGDVELSQWMHWEEFNVRSLKRLCRISIQRALGYSDSWRAKAFKLLLPDHLISYISMKEL